jgi:hypothetical protein
MKKETLEEAAEKYLQEWRLVNNIHLSNPIHAERCKNNFIAGAKWQQERMYSEEDLRKAFKHGILFKKQSVSTCEEAIETEFSMLVEKFKKK